MGSRRVQSLPSSELPNRPLPSINWARDLLKLVAIVAMTMDHASTILLDQGSAAYSICQFFGDFTIVIMTYFLVQGLKYTRSFTNYTLRMGLWALGAEIPYLMAFQGDPAILNVMVTLFATLICLHVLDTHGWRWWLLAYALCSPVLLFADWQIFPPIYAVVFRLADRTDRPWIPIVLLPAVHIALMAVLSSLPFGKILLQSLAFALVSALLWALDGQIRQKHKGLIPNIFFYAYYPAHLLVLWAVSKLLI